MKNKVVSLVGIVIALLSLQIHAATTWDTRDYDLYVGDFNGDGHDDILYIAKNPNNSSGIALSDASGGPNLSLQTWPSSYLGVTWSTSLYSVYVADFNGDGHADILLQALSPGGTSYQFFSNAQGQITANSLNQSIAGDASAPGGLIWSFDQHHIVVGDFNGDGKADVFLQSTSPSGTNAVILADASGHFTSATPAQQWGNSYLSLNWSTKNALVYAGNFNGAQVNGHPIFDLLVQAQPNFAIMDFDVPFPLPVFPGNMNGVVFSQGNSLFQSTGEQTWGRTAFGVNWSPLSSNVVVGQFNTSSCATCSSVILQNKNGTQSTFLLAGNASGTVFSTGSVLSSSEPLSANVYRLLAGNFGGGASAGLYLQAVNAEGTNYFADTVAGSSVIITAHDTYALTNPTTIPPSVSVVGRTAGQFMVSPNTGSATYTIPISAPPGPHGLQPNIALVYDSSGGNGYLGMGWSLAGLSSISRCNRTVAQDGAVAPITLTTSDALCLDGKRLRATSGFTPYCAGGTTYQTEVADFSNITACGTAGNGPSYFVVQGRDGSISQYGNGGYSQVLASGTSTAVAVAWMLNQVSDPAGNTMAISYQAANQDTNLQGMTVPAAISWTPTSYGADTYVYSMQFIYRTIPVPHTTGYLAGTLVQNAYLLTNVRIQDAGATVKNYVVSYTPSSSTGRETLTSLAECADAGATTCLAPTTFGYQSGQAGLGAATTLQNVSTLGRPPKIGDFNGDGLQDIAYFNCTGNCSSVAPAGTYRIVWGTSSGYANLSTDTGITATSGLDTSVGCVTGDADGSGEDGLLCQETTGWWYYKWNGSSFSRIPTNCGAGSTNEIVSAVLADVNGDGLPDFVYMDNYYIYVQLNTTGTGALNFASRQATLQPQSVPGYTDPFVWNVGPLTLDYYGSGQHDIILNYGPLDKGIVYSAVLHFTGTTFSISPPLSTSGNAVLAIADFNDDGCQDVLVNPTTVLLSACNGNAAATLALNSTDVILDQINWDGSAHPAILAENGTTLVLYTVTGTTLTRVPLQIPYSGSNTYMRLPNPTGDGLDGLGVFNFETVAQPMQYFLHNGPGQKPDLLTSVTDGYLNSQSLTYTPIAQGSYKNTLDAQYPYQNYAGPSYVISRATFSDPSSPGTAYYQNYTYAGGWMNLQGRGFTGFQSAQQYDSRSALWRTWAFQRDFPYTGLLVTDETGQDSLYAKPVSNLTNTLNNSSTCPLVTLSGTANNQRYFPHVCSATTQSYEVGGALDAQLITTNELTYTFDNWGNTTAVATTVTDNDPNSPYPNQNWTSATTTTIAPDTGINWCLGLPTQVQTTNQSPGTAAVMRTVSYNPDYAHCRASSKTTEPSSAKYQITESYGFDSFGNINSVAVGSPYVSQCPGGAPCTTQINWGATGQLPASITNALNQTTSINYDFRFGSLSTLTDPNGNTTFYQYDQFGRKAQEDRNDGTYTIWTYEDCANAGGCLLANHTLALVQAVYNMDGSVQTDGTTYFDQGERPLVRTHRLIGAGAYDRRERRYDSFGRVTRVYMPCSWSALTTVCPSFSSNFYDAVGRLYKIQRPIGASNPAPQTTSILYQGRTTTTTDPYLNKSTRITTVAGTMGRSTDANNYYQAFTYDGFNSLLGVTDNLGNSLFSASYDYGIGAFQKSITDMDLGTRTRTVDALGEVTAYTDSNGQSFSMRYDVLSRMTDRYEPDLYTHWTWGTNAAADEIGQLNNVCTGLGSNPSNCTSSPGYAESYTYDWAGRVSTRQITSDAAYLFAYSYDPNTGSLSSLKYPVSTNNFAVAVNYGYQNGLLQNVTDASSGTVYWTANSEDPWHNITQATLGNGVIVSRTFDSVTGWLSTMQAGVGGGTGLANQSYFFDEMGNLQQQQNNTLGLTENFYYDSVYRLDHSTLTTSAGTSNNLQMHYDVTGNITARSDVNGGATWSYDPNRKHAVTGAGTGLSYAYDGNGNMTSRAGNIIQWSSYNYPTQIAGNGETVQFSYDHNRMRWKQTYNYSAGTETTYYIGGLLEKTLLPDGSTDFRHYIYADGQPVAILSRSSTGTNAPHYALEDHLGSTASVLDSSGNETVNESFAAYGTERDPTTWSGTPSPGDLTTIAGISRRGYTFHTMLGSPAFGLIHMNGRVEDSIIGRFLSPDPNVQDPGSTQSFNRYSYADNNPLTMADPTGFDWTDCNPWVDADQFTDLSPCQSFESYSQTPPNQQAPPNRSTPGCWWGLCEHRSSTPAAPPPAPKPPPPAQLTKIPQTNPNVAGTGSAPEGNPNPILCTIAGTVAGTISGSIGGFVFAVSSGAVLNPYAFAASVIGGGIVGGAVAYLAPQGGYQGLAAAAVGTLAAHTTGGTVADGFAGVVGDTLGGAAAPPIGERGAGAISPAAAVPISAGFGALQGALATEGVLAEAGVVAGAFIGATSGSLGGAAALATNAALSAIIYKATGCH